VELAVAHFSAAVSFDPFALVLAQIAQAADRLVDETRQVAADEAGVLARDDDLRAER